MDEACKLQLRSQQRVDGLFLSKNKTIWTALKYTHQFKNMQRHTHIQKRGKIKKTKQGVEFCDNFKDRFTLWF